MSNNKNVPFNPNDNIPKPLYGSPFPYKRKNDKLLKILYGVIAGVIIAGILVLILL